MSSNKDCEYGIDCNRCKTRGMCTSYANHMYSMGVMYGRENERERIIESLLPSDKMIVNRDDFTEDLINQGYNKALREVIEVMSMDIVDCNTCPLGCKHGTYGECEENLRRYIFEQIKERD